MRLGAPVNSSSSPFPDGISAWFVRWDTVSTKFSGSCQQNVPLLLHFLVLHQLWCFWARSNSPFPPDYWVLFCVSLLLLSFRAVLGQFIYSDSGSSLPRARNACFWSRSSRWTLMYTVPEWKMNLVRTDFTLVSLCTAILDQICGVHERLPLWSRCCQWIVEYTAHYWKINLLRTQFTLWENAVRSFLNKIQCKTLKPRCFFKNSPVEWREQLTLKWIRFGLVLIPRFALNIHYRTGFVFLLRFLNVRHSCVQVCSPIATGLFMSVPWELRPFFPPEE